MTTELRVFKHIPCPKGNECTAVRCLFRHNGDDEELPVEGNKKGEKVELIGDENSSPVSSQEGPRKRVKTGQEEYDPTSPTFIPKPTSPVSTPGTLKQPEHRESSLAESAKEPEPKTSTKLDSLAKDTRKLTSRPVSPPALKRKSLESTPPFSKTPKAISAATVADSSVATPSKSTEPSPFALKKARKPESLNPRLLKPAPASHATRLSLLKLLHGEFKRLNNELKKVATDEQKDLILNDQEVIWLALDLEENFAKGKGPVYSNTIKNRIVLYKKMPLSEWNLERVAARERAIEAAHKGIERTKTNVPVVIKTDLTVSQELDLIHKKLLTPIDGMTKYHYVPKVPTQIDIQKAREADEISKGFEACDRCGTRFQVFPGRREEDGALTSAGTCTHHPGRAYYPIRKPGESGGAAKRFRCCGQAMGDSAGCVKGETHVFKTTDANRLATVWNFMETPMNPDAPTDRAVAFDCEMGYTTKGLELIRLTATSWPTGEELLDVLVVPFGEVLDLNSRYSGVYAEDMKDSIPLVAPFSPLPQQIGQRKRLQRVASPFIARDLLFGLINQSTPLIGHGLENDLNSMRIVHPTIVDTVLLFPHPKGLPIRNGLKYLAETHLNRRIQQEPAEGQLAGHDSAEDSITAGELVRFKVMKLWQNLKADGWTIEEDGSLAPPS